MEPVITLLLSWLGQVVPLPKLTTTWIVSLPDGSSGASSIQTRQILRPPAAV
nr:hypothetical protein Iba_scaffold30525CG0050 [Ipomoea batatas]GMC96435.1 hypothetical protein Iba_chr05cCG18060 [Ipomoea batatas]GMC98607.1 hypothetical protein Iba_chr05dCG18130 [Ipomoea batatas]GMD02341.1 hypothetical protein Iba_chr05fCG15690 [Ipomoea batatas]